MTHKRKLKLYFLLLVAWIFLVFAPNTTQEN